MRRIAFISDEIPYDEAAGGIASYINHRAHVLSRHDWEVWWCSQDQIAVFDETSKSWVHVERSESSMFRRRLAAYYYSWSNIFEMMMRKYQIGLYEFPDSNSTLIPPKTGNQKYIIQSHTTTPIRYFLSKEPFSRKAFNLRMKSNLQRRNYYRADQLLACSHEVALLTSGFFRVHPERFLVLPHVLSADSETGLKMLASEQHDGFFLVAGNIEFVKGTDLLIRAYLEYIHQGGRFNLVFAGSRGPEDPNPQVQRMLKSLPENQIRELVQTGKINFLGRVGKSRLAELRSRATAILIGSRFESFSMVAGEAFLTGCPVIMSDRTGWRGIVERFDGAMMMNPYDCGDFARCMRAIEDSATREKLRQGAIRIGKYVQSDELIQQTVRAYDQVFQTIEATSHR